MRPERVGGVPVDEAYLLAPAAALELMEGALADPEMTDEEALAYVERSLADFPQDFAELMDVEALAKALEAGMGAAAVAGAQAALEETKR